MPSRAAEWRARSASAPESIPYGHQVEVQYAGSAEQGQISA